jgi:CRISPR-associated endonuclease/helicase Cas3
VIKEDLLEVYPPDELLEDYPLKPHELLRDRYDRIFDQLKAIAERGPQLPVWITDYGETVAVKTLEALVEAGKQALANKTVILPPSAGGLGFGEDDQPTGLLDGNRKFIELARDLYDIADRWCDISGSPHRCRLWDGAELADKSMRLVRVIDTRPEDEEYEAEEGTADVASKPRFWRWYVRPRSADDDGSRAAREPQELQPHLRCAHDFADAIVTKLGLSEPESTAVRLAARWHDLGKQRQPWQRAIGNHAYPQIVLAKSGGKMRPLDLNRYRHEFGSLIDVNMEVEFQKLDETMRDLVLHLIAAHHGRARPHFPAEEAIDPERPVSLVATIARSVPQRFARLQRRYGRWGLAYLESLLRAADIMASQEKLSETPAASACESSRGATP